MVDHFGNSLITVVLVPATTLEVWPAQLQPNIEFTPEDEAHFFEAPTLLGIQSFDDSSKLNLFWRSDGHTSRDLTTFIHLIDADGRRVGQTDKLPGNGRRIARPIGAKANGSSTATTRRSRISAPAAKR